MNIDGLFISSVLRSDPQIVRKIIRHVPVELVQGEERNIYQFINKYYASSRGEFPSREVIRKKFPDFKFIIPKDHISFYADELKNRKKYEVITKYMVKMQGAALVKDVDKAVSMYYEMGKEITSVDIAEGLTAKGSFAERKKDYETAKSSGGIIGLQTKITKLDNHIGGLQDEMFVLLGRRGVGKTFMSIFLMKNLWTQLRGPILYVTNELAPKKILLRVDSAVARLPYSLYRKGKLSKKQEQRMLKLERIYSKRPELHVVKGTSKSVSEIEFEIINLRPALLVVDGLHLTNMGYNDSFKDAFNASRQYRELVKKYEIPGIFTAQATQEEEAKYARAMEEDADMVALMFQSPQLYDDSVMGFNFTKIREEDSHLKFYMNWKFDNWDFSERDYDVPDGDEEDTYE